MSASKNARKTSITLARAHVAEDPEMDFMNCLLQVNAQFADTLSLATRKRGSTWLVRRLAEEEETPPPRLTSVDYISDE